MVFKDDPSRGPPVVVLWSPAVHLMSTSPSATVFYSAVDLLQTSTNSLPARGIPEVCTEYQHA